MRVLRKGLLQLVMMVMNEKYDLFLNVCYSYKVRFFVFRDVPANAALPVIRPALGRQHSMSDRAKVAMQQYLNHFLGNMDIVNSREVCLAFSRNLC